MADPGGNPWWVVLAAAVPSAASGAWVFWRWWVERGDKRLDTTLTREERLTREMDARILSAAKIDADLIARGLTEITRLQIRNQTLEEFRDRIESDRDRGWDLARYWYGRTHDAVHDLRNLRALVNAMLVASGKPPRDWPDATLPGLEDPT